MPGKSHERRGNRRDDRNGHRNDSGRGKPHPRERLSRGGLGEIWDAFRRAMSDFLVVPLWIVLGFILLAAGVHILDLSDPGWLRPVHDFLAHRYFTSTSVTHGFFSTLTGAIITAVSITFTLLLIALQQAAAPMGFQVFDQFLRRAVNQVFFGFFVGIAIFTLLLLPTADGNFNPVYSAGLEVLLMVAALLLFLFLVYATIDQTRPVAIVEAIHQHTLLARGRQLKWLGRLRTKPSYNGPVRRLVHAPADGFVTHLHLDAIVDVSTAPGREVEVVLLVHLGSFVAFGDAVAEVRAANDEDADAVVGQVRAAIELERQRDIDSDPGYGVDQIGMIGWTSVSTAKSNPAIGQIAVNALYDILSRWVAEEWGQHASIKDIVQSTDTSTALDIESHPGSPHHDWFSNHSEDKQKELPVVYTDNLYEQMINTLESLGVAASESMQHQTLADVLDAFTSVYGRLKKKLRPKVESAILRLLSALGDQVLTGELEGSLHALERALNEHGAHDVAEHVRCAREELAASIGKLNSRSTRARAYHQLQPRQQSGQGQSEQGQANQNQSGQHQSERHQQQQKNQPKTGQRQSRHGQSRHGQSEQGTSGTHQEGITIRPTGSTSRLLPPDPHQSAVDEKDEQEGRSQSESVGQK